MNILYLAVSFNFGGAERQFCELVKGMAESDVVVAHVYYLEEGEKGYKQDLIQAGIEPVHLPRRGRYDVSLPLRLRGVIKEKRIDLVHSFMPLAGLVASVGGRLAGKPVICSSIRNAKNVKGLSLTLRLQAALSAILVSNSHAGLKSHFSKTRPKYRVVYNGMDLRRFTPEDRQAAGLRERFGLDRFSDVVTMVASMTRDKDQDAFLASAPEVLKRHPNTVFLLVGDGPTRGALEEKAAELGIQKNVIFAGYSNQVVEILRLTDVSVLMTNARFHAEGLSNSLLESLAMGVPAIGSKGGGTGEIIDDGVNGFIVNPHDVHGLAERTSRLLDDAGLRKKIGQNGRAMVEIKFGYKRYLRDYLDIYEEVLMGISR